MSQSLNASKESRSLERPLWSLRVSDPPEASLLEQSRKGFSTLMERRDVGFTRLASRDGRMSALMSAIETRAREIARTSTHMVVIGMGGSSLGTRAILSAAPRPQGRGMVTFLDNIDSDRFWTWMRSRHDLGAIHWVLVSKSGNTIETLTLADLIDQQLRQSGHRRLGTVSTVVSELKESPLTLWARREAVPVLEIPTDVGGRFSVLTAVGLLPASYAGLRLDRILEGAQWATGQQEQVALMAGCSLDSFLREEWVTMLWSYSDGLRDFGGWWQQLWAESLAKRVNRSEGPAPRVSTPIAAIGSCDQHSLLQQVIEGAPDKFIWFQRVEESEEAGPRLERTLFEGQELMVGKGLGDLFRAEADATEKAMREAQVRSATLTGLKLDERTMAALFMLWQLAIGTMGEVLAINAFNQPGVERGKELARMSLSGAKQV